MGSSVPDADMELQTKLGPTSKLQPEAHFICNTANLSEADCSRSKVLSIGRTTGAAKKFDAER
jgi:hypothetical protein